MMRDRSPSTFPAARRGDLATTPPARGGLRVAVIAGLLCLLVYSANLRSVSAGDTYPARYLPFAIWRWHTVLLDPIKDLTAQGWTPIRPRKNKDSPKSVDPQEAYWVVQLPTGHAISLYPLVVPLLVAPLYLPAVVYLRATGWDPEQMDRVARVMEKLSASLLAAVSAALFLLLLRRRVGSRPALLLTIAYAFGTTTWMIGSQALWQHGAGELLVVCALLFLTEECGRSRAVTAGAILGLIAANRPPDGIIAAALGVYALWWARRFRFALIVGVLLPTIPLLVYNLKIAGHIAGAYGLVGDVSFLQHNPLAGLAGLLLSPTKGLLVFSPFLVFVPFCAPLLLREEPTRRIGAAAVSAVVLQLMFYSVADWRQGGSWGPRWLTDLVPLLVWMLAPAVTGFNKAARAAFVFAVGSGVVIEAIGAFWYTGASNAAVYASATEANPMRSAWEPGNAPFLAELRHPRAPLELGANVRGYIDTMTIGYGPAGRAVELEGWATADGHSPSEVVALRDGHPAATGTAFGPRPDVSRALGAKGPSGWHLTVPASDLSPGEHRVAVLVRAYPGGDTRLLAERSFQVPGGSDLAFSANLAEEILSSRQQQAGYWLTSYTAQPRFDHPQVEMNTYLPSVLLDILGPVANRAGLQASMERARHFLTRQIEGSGLVRYHGLPDAPTIGTLGCAITPDADDTALVWRIAPSDRLPLRQDALATLAAFRNPKGLYRTWLAPRDRYQCIDPGSDPDPADAGIQMHIFLWLSKADPPAAKALCSALQQTVNDDRIWVYYKSAPLIPVLRQADLREAGCSLPLPPSHLRTTMADQEIWVSAARMLDRARSDAGPPRPSDVRGLLQRLAGDDFSMVRLSPPLLYHNDPSASVPRFYWSEDFGYALWLRLYFELGQDTVAGGVR